MYYCALLRVRFFISFHIIPYPSPPGQTQSVSGLIFSIIYVKLCIITCTFLYILPCNTMSFTCWTNSESKWSDHFYHSCITVHYYVYVFFISFHVIPCPSPPGLTQSVSGLIFSIIYLKLCIITFTFLYILPCNTMSFTSWTNTACKWSDLFSHLCNTVQYYVYVSLYPSM